MDETVYPAGRSRRKIRKRILNLEATLVPYQDPDLEAWLAPRDAKAERLDQKCAAAVASRGDDLDRREADELGLQARLKVLDARVHPDGVFEVEKARQAFERDLFVDAHPVDLCRIFVSAGHLRLLPMVQRGWLGPLRARRFMETIAGLYSNLGLIRRADLNELIDHVINGTIPLKMPKLLSARYRS
jgi:hypothetical protein